MSYGEREATKVNKQKEFGSRRLGGGWWARCKWVKQLTHRYERREVKRILKEAEGTSFTEEITL